MPRWRNTRCDQLSHRPKVLSGIDCELQAKPTACTTSDAGTPRRTERRYAPRSAGTGRNDVQPVTTRLSDSVQLLKYPHLILNMLEDLVRNHEIKRVVLIRQP